jgi:hypothetical protein
MTAEPEHITKPDATNSDRFRVVSSIAAAWIASIGFDLFLHGGVLARLYTSSNPFLLPPADAFRRIPLGYLAFLVLTVALFWTMRRLDIGGFVPGLRFGAISGFALWGALALGLYSVSTASIALLGGWWIGQTLELALAGAVLGTAAKGAKLRRVWTRVIVFVITCMIATVALQSLGLAPTLKISP